MAVNKLDVDGWSESRYDEVCQLVLPFLVKVGYKEDNIQFVPLSALLGLNLESRDLQPEELKSWYHSEAEDKFKKGRSLVEVIDSFRGRPKPVKKPIRVCVYDYLNKGQDAFSAVSGDCCSVKVESGVIKEKDKLLLMPLGAEVTIKAIEKQKEKVNYAHAGDMCEI